MLHKVTVVLTTVLMIVLLLILILAKVHYYSAECYTATATVVNITQDREVHCIDTNGFYWAFFAESINTLSVGDEIKLIINQGEFSGYIHDDKVIDYKIIRQF